MDKEQNSLASLLNVLAFVHTEADLQRFRARARKWNVLLAIPTLLLFLFFMETTLSNASHHIQVRDWWSLAGDLLSSFLAIFCLLTFFKPAYKSVWGSSSLPEKVLELRQRLNNERLVPPVAEHPSPLKLEKSLSLQRVSVQCAVSKASLSSSLARASFYCSSMFCWLPASQLFSPGFKYHSTFGQLLL